MEEISNFVKIYYECYVGLILPLIWQCLILRQVSRVIEPSSFVKPGVSHIGGKLPRQLRELCVDLTSVEREEELTYRAWREGGKSHRALIQSLCLKKHCSGVATNYFIFS